MFERYTERARRVIFFARYEASTLASSAISTEHLLLGLLRESGGVAGKVLRRRRLTYQAARKQIEALAVPGGSKGTSVDLPLSTEAKRALEDAVEEADRIDAPEIDTEQLLLGLLRQPDCPATEILRSKGLTLEGVREETRLRARPNAAVPRPTEAFPKLADLLQQLEDRGAAYHVSPFGQEAIRVEIGLPDEKWVATFFPDAHVAVEVFAQSGGTEAESALDRLLARLGPPKETGA